MKKHSPTYYIVGSGAIGKALAVTLQLHDRSVILVRGSVDNLPDQTEKIILQDITHGTLEAEIKVTTFSNLSELNGLVVITTKAFGNDALAATLQNKKGDFTLVILQNGLNVEAPFASFSEVYRGVLFATSQVLENGTVSFKSVAPSPVGPFRSSRTQTAEVVEALHTKYFSFTAEEHIARIAWEKTITNCAFNTLCPLLETDNGIFHRDEKALALASLVIKECVTLAKEYGIVLDESAIQQRLLLISQRSDGQLISTYQDLLHRRKTEIDSLNLEVARLAAQINKPELTALTGALGNMIVIKSETHAS